MTVVERVAAMLCALVDNLSPFRQTDVIPGELHQVDMAALVSARQETVCRAMCALERRGLISRDGEGIRITDRRRLEAA
jgi:CRP-like cAMP-binding protein